MSTPQPQPVKSEEPPMHSLTPTPPTPATPQAVPAASYTWAIDPALQAQSATAQNTTATSNAPTPTPTATTTPAPTTYQYAQPGSTGTYQYGYYPGYYGYHAQAGTATAAPTATPATTSTSTTAANTTSTAANNQVDSSDIATLNDALGSAGVDLRAEEESLQTQTSSFRTSNTYLSAQHGDRTRKQPPAPAFNTTFIAATMKTIGAQHKITRIPEDSVNYLSLALRARLGDLITNMIKASAHRTSTQFDRPATLYPAPSIDATKGGVIVNPDGSSQQVSEAMVTDPIPMWSILIRSDVAKQLGAIEKVERDEELRVRRERKERAELAASHAAALAAASSGSNSGTGAGAGDGDEDGQPKKKRKKEGPGVTARNMSEDVRKKMSNAVASQAAGLGGRYAWMTAANANAPPPPKKAAPAPSTSVPTTGAPSTPTPAPKVYTATTGTAAMKVDEDPRMKVTMRDAMFVVSTERGHGGGRGAARGWT